VSLNPKWVPMQWSCGPREIEQLKNDENGDAKFQNTAMRWAHPASLQLLKGSPVNCLIVDWADGTPVDEAQQKGLIPLIDAGRKLGLSFVGRIATNQNLEAIGNAASAAGLAAVMLEKLPAKDLALPVIVPFPNDDTDWNRVTDIYRATGAIWPGSDLPTNSENSAEIGGPTGVPSVNSNGWFSLLSREVASGKIPWWDIAPPASSTIVAADEYCRVIADSRMYGSHWIVALDFWLRQSLLDGEQRAADTWAEISRELAFFERHVGWDASNPMGVLAVVSDFAGLNAIPSGEVLSFLNRSQTQFLAVDRLRMKTTPENGVKGILWMDGAEPSAAQREELLQFVQQGGLVMASKYWGPDGLAPTQEDWIPEYTIYNLAKGRIAVANGGLVDTYLLSRYAHLLVGRRYDFMRLFNPEMINGYSSIHPDGHLQIVQLVNYGPSPVEYMSLWVNAKAKSATFTTPQSEGPMPLQCFPSSGGTEFHIPKVTVNCAVEIERIA